MNLIITKKHKLTAIFICFFLLLSFIFYWYELRPIKIKKDCSWTVRIMPSQPAVDAVSLEDAQSKNKENEEKNPPICKTLKGLEKLLNNCESTDLRATPAKPAVPMKIIRENASNDEYQKCLRHNGL